MHHAFLVIWARIELHCTELNEATQALGSTHATRAIEAWCLLPDGFNESGAWTYGNVQGTLLGTPIREPQEYSRNIIGMYLPGSLYSIIFLLYSWGSLSGVASKVPLNVVAEGTRLGP